MASKKSLFRFLESLHFGSLLYFYSIFLCPPLPLGILLNPERSPFYAQFICLLPPLPIFISKTKALTWTNSTISYIHIFLKGKAESLEFPFPRILIVFSIICRNIGVETNVGWQGEWQDQSPAWPGQVIANNKKVTHTKHFLIKISQTRSTDMSEHSNILSESRKNMILNRS